MCVSSEGNTALGAFNFRFVPLVLNLLCSLVVVADVGKFVGDGDFDGAGEIDGWLDTEGVIEGYSEGVDVGSLVGTRLFLSSHLSVSVIPVGYNGRSLHSRG